MTRATLLIGMIIALGLISAFLGPGLQVIAEDNSANNPLVGSQIANSTAKLSSVWVNKDPSLLIAHPANFSATAEKSLVLFPITAEDDGFEQKRSQPQPRPLARRSIGGILTPSYVNHAPISISSNSEFSSLGFSGSGTPEDPFRIEDFNITASSGTLIAISNTTAYFSLSKNLLNGLTTASSGIGLYNVTHGTIALNLIGNNSNAGIAVNSSSSIIITENTVKSSEDGVRVVDTPNTVVFANNVTNNAGFGIYLESANNSSLSNNSIHDNLQNGLYLKETSNTTITVNTISNHWSADYNFSNILLENASKNIIANNSVFNSHYGLNLLSSANENLIANNTIHDHLQHGLRLEYASRNTILHNSILSNRFHGMLLTYGANENPIHFNDFQGNNVGGRQAQDDGANNVFAGNYWSDWRSPDADADSILDSPYPLAGSANNSDLMPLATMDAHILLPIDVIFPNGGENLSGNITIRWSASRDSNGHPILYAVYYSSVDGSSWTQLAFALTATSFLWDTTSDTDLRGGNFRIKIVAYDDRGLLIEDSSDGPFAIENTKSGSKSFELPLLVILGLLFLILLALGLGLGYFWFNAKSKKQPSFSTFIQTAQIDFLEVLYFKTRMALEAVRMELLTEGELNEESTALISYVPPEEPEDLAVIDTVEPPVLVDSFPHDIRQDLKSAMKGRTVMTLIEIAYQDPDNTNPARLAESLDIPLPSLTREIKRLHELQYIESFVSVKVLRDGRYRNYTITAKGIRFLYTLKDTLQLTITRLKESQSM
ncbi:MAG: right-handed parallel beta-helix repeat-containing protein [Candidatus Heimdallarchaeota archaeon]